jgi:hypothetical protein
MAWVLAQFGPVGFVTVKVGVTALAVAFLLFHVRFRCTRALLPVTHVVYTCLLFIHIATEMVT